MFELLTGRYAQPGLANAKLIFFNYYFNAAKIIVFFNSLITFSAWTALRSLALIP